MKNPYLSQPDQAFWRRAISAVPPDLVDPVGKVPFGIEATHQVATAGSCFAQHISRILVAEGFPYLVTEKAPGTSGALDENYGTFSARFGNVYTVRQLLQLFQRAYGLFDPLDKFWKGNDGGLIDPFRPRIQAGGFLTKTDLINDLRSHLKAVRECFELCDVFVFTLGLTEAWISKLDGAVFPLAPAVVGGSDHPDTYEFQNFDVGSVMSDLTTFIDYFRVVNPNGKVILTVSPVPLIATFEDRHVLTATTYSKSVLRVAADVASRQRENVAYFPSYEIITGIQTRSRFFADDLREVTADGVAHVMSLFKKHFLTARSGKEVSTLRTTTSSLNMSPQVVDARPSDHREMKRATLMADAERMAHIICDEEALDAVGYPPPLGGQ